MGTHYIVPSEVLKKYSGGVLLREEFEKDLLRQELGESGYRDLSLGYPIRGTVARKIQIPGLRLENLTTEMKISQ